MAMFKKDMLKRMKMPGARPKPSTLEIEVSSEEPKSEADEMLSEEEMAAADEMSAPTDLTSIPDEELMAEIERRGLMS